MKAPANSHVEGGVKKINTELWQACAGPLVSLPAAGTHVVYFPQGHSEQVAASMNKGVDAQIPSYPNLQSKLLCIVHSVTLHADPDTDEVYAQMTLQPVPAFDKEELFRSDLSMKAYRPQTEFFCKTLTASDTSTHGGFSVPRRAAEKIFPPLDFALQPPAQELVARDLHDYLWTFRHIFRGQPKRHLLTTGWSLFINGKRLSAGDSVLFIRDVKQQLLLGIRRAIRQPANLSSSVLTSDSMHIGVLAAAAHAAANNSPFTVFYNPRTSPSEFVIPLAKYYKAVCSNQLSLGMRFRMMFETEESGTRRYMGTITGISDLDGVRWKNSQWRNIQVGWDESHDCQRLTRVSIWEIEPITAPFFMCPTPYYGINHPRQPGIADDEHADLDNLFKRPMPWLGEDMSKDTGLSLVQWMTMQQSSLQTSYLNPLPGSVLPQILAPGTSEFNIQRSTPQLDQLQKFPVPATVNPLVSTMQHQQQMPVLSPQTMRQNVVINQPPPQNRVQSKIQSRNVLQQQSSDQNYQQQLSRQLSMPANQAQPQKLHQQQQSLLAHQSAHPQVQQKPLANVSQSFSRPMSTNQRMEIPSPMPRNNSQTNSWFSASSQQPKLHNQQPTNQFMTHGNGLLMGAAGPVGQSGVTDDSPSCSTSPSENDGAVMLPSMIDRRSYLTTSMGGEEITHMNTNGLEAVAPDVDVVNDFHQKSVLKSSVDISDSQNKGFLNSQIFLDHFGGTQVDYLESSSSGTSVCLSQNDVRLQHQNSNHLSFNPQPVPFRDTIPDDPGTHISFGKNNDNLLGSGSDFQSNLSYEHPTKDNQPELSSFGVPNMTFNSIDDSIDGSNLLNNGVWGPTPQPFQRMRTYTKVYKRGAVGRSIDITAYSDYQELKHDLARRFGIEGQLEDRQRIGWKLVYVDHENDVLLVGDDPWEEFVSCVRCIKILSPQEVEQMSLDGDFGRNNVLPNQACSSSDL